MSKSTHFTGQPLYTQLLKLVNKQRIQQISKNGKHDHYVKKLDGYSHLAILLYGVLMRHDSLREIVIGMLSEAHKLQHIGIDYMVKRSTLSEANNRRSSDFFAQVYFSLYKQYNKVLADSRDKSWGKMLHIMDSTTISLFSSVLKGVGRNPKHGKKKGGIKVHTVLRAAEGVPHSIHFSSAATHDHVMLKKLNLSNGSFTAMDRAYIDYRVFEQFTKDGVFYVTKMKKNQRFRQIERYYMAN